MSFESLSSYNASIKKEEVINSIRTDLYTDPLLLQKFNRYLKNNTEYKYLKHETNWYKMKFDENIPCSKITNT
jgi:hypothetical protein